MDMIEEEGQINLQLYAITKGRHIPGSPETFPSDSSKVNIIDFMRSLNDKEKGNICYKTSVQTDEYTRKSLACLVAALTTFTVKVIRCNEQC